MDLSVQEVFFGFAGLVVAVGTYLLNRLKALEKNNALYRQAELEDKNEQIAALETRLANAEFQAQKVPDLERQLRVVCRELDELQLWKQNAQAVSERKDRRIADLEQTNARLVASNTALKSENRAYQRALHLVRVSPSGLVPFTPIQSSKED